MGDELPGTAALDDPGGPGALADGALRDAETACRPVVGVAGVEELATGIEAIEDARVEAFPDDAAVNLLRELGVRYVVVHMTMLRSWDPDRAAVIQTAIAERSDVRLIAVVDDARLYELQMVEAAASR